MEIILIDHVAPSNINEITYDPFKDKLILTNNTAKKSTYHELSGSLVNPTMNFVYPQYQKTITNLQVNKNGYIGFSGNELVLFENQTGSSLKINSIHKGTKKSIDLPSWANDFKILKVTSDYALIAVKYTGSPTFGGVQLPDSQGAHYWFVYKNNYISVADEPIILNNISTYNIVNVIDNSYLDNVNSGNIISASNALGIVVFDTQTNIPTLGTNMKTWGLWNVGTNQVEFLNNNSEIGVVKEDYFHNHFIDIIVYDSRYGTSTPVYKNKRLYLAAQQDIANISNQTAIKFIGFPNPATSNFSIKTQDLGIAKIVVYQTNGQAVISQNYQGQNQVNIAVSDLSQGVYFVKVFDSEGNVHHLKLIKE